MFAQVYVRVYLCIHFHQRAIYFFSAKKYFSNHIFVIFLKLLQLNHTLCFYLCSVSAHTPLHYPIISFLMTCNLTGHGTQNLVYYQLDLAFKKTHNAMLLYPQVRMSHNTHQGSFFSQQVAINVETHNQSVCRECSVLNRASVSYHFHKD